MRHLVVGAGKDGNIYLVDRDNMGKFDASANNIVQQLSAALQGCWCSPAYFNGTLYYPDTGGTLKAFTVSNALLSTAPSSQTATSFTYPGAGVAVSANGTANGIVWAYESSSPAVLHAYDARNLATELYNSNQAGNDRDQFGAGNKFITQGDRGWQGARGDAGLGGGLRPAAVGAGEQHRGAGRAPDQ